MILLLGESNVSFMCLAVKALQETNEACLVSFLEEPRTVTIAIITIYRVFYKNNELKSHCVDLLYFDGWWKTTTTWLVPRRYWINSSEIILKIISLYLSPSSEHFNLFLIYLIDNELISFSILRFYVKNI